MKKSGGNPRPSNGFKKGDPRCNRKGRPRLPPDLKAIDPLTPEYIKKCIAKFWDMEPEDLKDFVRSKSGSVGEQMIAAICAKALLEGDYTRLNFLLDRSIGKVKEVKELQLPTPTIVKRLNGEEAMTMGDAKALKAEVLDDE